MTPTCKSWVRRVHQDAKLRIVASGACCLLLLVQWQKDLFSFDLRNLVGTMSFVFLWISHGPDLSEDKDNFSPRILIQYSFRMKTYLFQRWCALTHVFMGCSLNNVRSSQWILSLLVGWRRCTFWGFAQTAFNIIGFGYLISPEFIWSGKLFATIAFQLF